MGARIMHAVLSIFRHELQLTVNEEDHDVGLPLCSRGDGQGNQAA